MVKPKATSRGGIQGIPAAPDLGTGPRLLPALARTGPSGHRLAQRAFLGTVWAPLCQMEITNTGHTVIKLPAFFGPKKNVPLGTFPQDCLRPTSSQLITKEFSKLALTEDQKGMGVHGGEAGVGKAL